MQRIVFTYYPGLLQYIYTNEVLLDREMALELLPLADEYLLKELLDFCEEFLSKTLSEYNVVDILSLANMHQISKLIDLCTKFIAANHLLMTSDEALCKDEKVYVFLNSVTGN